MFNVMEDCHCDNYTTMKDNIDDDANVKHNDVCDSHLSGNFTTIMDIPDDCHFSFWQTNPILYKSQRNLTQSQHNLTQSCD